MRDPSIKRVVLLEPTTTSHTGTRAFPSRLDVVMKVAVKLLGVLGDLADEVADATLEFTLPDTATAIDLVAQLAARFGGPFCEPISNGAVIGADSPSRLQIFVNGEYSPRKDRQLAQPETQAANVQIVISKPIVGG